MRLTCESPEATSARMAASRSGKPPTPSASTRACTLSWARRPAIGSVSPENIRHNVRRKILMARNIALSPRWSSAFRRSGKDELPPGSAPDGSLQSVDGTSVSGTLAAALAGCDVEVAAVEGLAPVGDQVLRVRQIIRPFVADDGRRLLDDFELAVSLDFADQHRLGDVMVRHDGRIATGEVRHGDADDVVENGIRVGGTGGLDGFHPGVEADIGGFHRVVGHALVVLGERMPFLDELLVGRAFDRLEVIPGSEMADQRLGVEAGQLFFADREGDDRDVGCLDALIAEFLVKRHVGIAVDGGDDGGLLAGRAEFLDLGDFRLPVGEAEGRVVDENVFLRNALGFEIGRKDLVGRTGIDVVGAFEHEALHALGLHQVIDGRDRLLVRRRTCIEDVARGFLAFILHGVEKQRVQLFEDREDGFARGRRPATEHGGDLVLFDQLARLFGKERPVGSRIDDDGFQLLAEKAALLVLLVDEHQHGVFQRGFGNRHRAGERMQHADLDGIVGSDRAMEGGRCRHDGAECSAGKNGFEIHLVDPLFVPQQA
ncbi:hypothetical protein RHECNPAF_3500024 [Rhizobium etli CNPAF512]|nr:hypothetical protein RHECNPAF_3500024 [Rhizobium etli CNPAF512]